MEYAHILDKDDICHIIPTGEALFIYISIPPTIYLSIVVSAAKTHGHS